MRWKQILLIVVVALVLPGIAAYLLRPSRKDAIGDKKSPVPGSSRQANTAPQGDSTSSVNSCVDARNPLVRQVFLSDRHASAIALVYKKRFDAAVQVLRDLAAVDPGYPGVNLDISDALLKNSDAEDAKTAVISQIAISECLSRLPDQVLRKYCESELALSNVGSCRPQLAQTLRAARFQATVVDVTLAERFESTSEVKTKETSAAVPRSARQDTPPTPFRRAAIDLPAAPQRIATAAPAPVERIATAAPAPVERIATAAPAPAVQPDEKPVVQIETTASASGILQSSEASQHVGETRTVCGPVVGKHTADGVNGTPTFVELDRAYPHQIFTVLIWGSEKDEVGELPASGNVCVTGKISEYSGLPEIVLHDAKSWSVPGKPPTP